MTDLVAVKRSRVSVKGWATRAQTSLEKALKEKSSVTIIKNYIADLEKRLAALEKAQTAVENFLDKESDLLADIEEQGEFYDGLVDTKIRALDYMNSLGSGNSSQKPTGNPNVRLPKLEIEKFTGKILDYKRWFQTFKIAVHDSNISQIQKFTYLVSLLEGEAAQTVQGLSLTEENYSAAIQLLENKYGREELHKFKHVQSLMELPLPSNQSSLSQVKELETKILVHIRSLESLGVSGKEYGVILTPMILMRLPPNIRLEWARDSEGKESDLEHLLSFIRQEICRRERSEIFKPTPDPSKEPSPPGSSGQLNSWRPGQPPLSKQPGGTTPRQPRLCFNCNQPSHGIFKCFQFLSLDISARIDRLKELKLCQKCFMPSHTSENCEKTCVKCKGPHNVLVCQARINSNPVVKDSNSNVSSSGATDGQILTVNRENLHYCTIMPTATVTAVGQKSVECTILFDSGADRTYVTSEIVQKIKPKYLGSEQISHTAFGNSNPSTDIRNKFSLKLVRGNVEVDLQATEIPTICAQMKRPKLPESLVSKLKNIDLANSRLDSSSLKIDILVGLDQLWSILDATPPLVLSAEPPVVAQNSRFGYVVSGSFDQRSGTSSTFSQLISFSSDSILAEAPKMWDLDSIGVSDESRDSVFFENFVSKNLAFLESENRYQASLPWKFDFPDLPSNFSLAKRHLFSLSRRLNRDPKLADDYGQVFDNWEQNFIISEVPSSQLNGDGPIHYLTHRPVVREDSTTTKVRPVFNASLKGVNGISLNDCLDPGPSLIPLAVDLLVRFRRWPFVVTSDISKAFLQILLDPVDRDSHRFLLMKDNQIRVMKFNRITFGVNASPFILNATLKFHFSKYDDEHAVTELFENLFVDDFLSGANSKVDAKNLVLRATEIVKEAGMNLSKWRSNCDILETLETPVNLAPCNSDDHPKVLGVSWNSELDAFCFIGLPISTDLVITKRIVLSLIARVYDPFGFIMPFVQTLKILFQDCWSSELEWDQALDSELYLISSKWIQDLETVRSLQIPRQFSISHLEWTIEGVKLCVFADSSSRGYGCCIYLVLPSSDNFESALVLSRARVAPLVKQSLPRLELLGCLLAARSVSSVQKALKLEDCIVVCYTDSTIALSWIQSSPEKWKLWVSRRVSEIRSLTKPENWRHISSKENVADLLTRGLSASQLVNNKVWFQGPEFIRHSESDSSVCDKVDAAAPISPELLSLALSVETRETVELLPAITGFDVSKFGNLMKAVRVLAYVRRYISNLKALKQDRNHADLLVVELHEAQMVLLRQAQLQAFPEEIALLKNGKTLPPSSKLCKLSPRLCETSGLLRKQTRLEQSDISTSTQSPIILPKCHLTKILVRFVHNILMHPGVNTMITVITGSYSILGLRSIAKDVKRSCIACQKLDSKPFNEVAAPLPRDRITKSQPFSIIGVDYAGPLYVSDQDGKLYILLCTCAVTRAVHLELVDNMSLPTLVLAIRRLSARRGRPKIIYSDNASTFKGAENYLTQYFGVTSPQWKFIAPRSPWWGGWWERLVQSTKHSLIKSLGKKRLSRIELETILFEIESSINSRPLVQVTDTSRILTPNDFLLGQQSGFDALDDQSQTLPVTPKELSERETERLKFLENCWKVWSTTYIRNLPTCVSKFSKRGTIEIGRLVLIYEDKPARRQNWPLGIVVKLHYGSDDICRAADVKTSAGIRTRDIRRLYNLELTANCPERLETNSDPLPETETDPREVIENREDTTCDIAEDEDEIESREVTVTRSGRQVISPDRYVATLNVTLK